jgi:phosphoribosylformylglycinamidine synthase
MRNAGLRFRCKPVWVRVESARTPFTTGITPGTVLRMPIAHGDGAYLADQATLRTLDAEARVVFRYCDAAGRASPEANPNGSALGIAGVADTRGNVVGLMPHPERASEALLGSADGRRLFEAAAAWLASRPEAAAAPAQRGGAQ